MKCHRFIDLYDKNGGAVNTQMGLQGMEIAHGCISTSRLPMGFVVCQGWVLLSQMTGALFKNKKVGSLLGIFF